MDSVKLTSEGKIKFSIENDLDKEVTQDMNGIHIVMSIHDFRNLQDAFNNLGTTNIHDVTVRPDVFDSLANGGHLLSDLHGATPHIGNYVQLISNRKKFMVISDVKQAYQPDGILKYILELKNV